MRLKKLPAIAFALLFLGRTVSASYAQSGLSTDYFKIQINTKGFITSMKNITVKPFREFSINDKPSPLMCLYSSSKKSISNQRRQRLKKVKQLLHSPIPMVP